VVDNIFRVRDERVERADVIHQRIREDTVKDGAYTNDRNEVECACAGFEERTWDAMRMHDRLVSIIIEMNLNRMHPTWETGRYSWPCRNASACKPSTGYHTHPADWAPTLGKHVLSGVAGGAGQVMIT
jgi:hypothetical protein